MVLNNNTSCRIVCFYIAQYGLVWSNMSPLWYSMFNVPKLLYDLVWLCMVLNALRWKCLKYACLDWFYWEKGAFDRMRRGSLVQKIINWANEQIETLKSSCQDPHAPCLPDLSPLCHPLSSSKLSLSSSTLQVNFSCHTIFILGSLKIKRKVRFGNITFCSV